MPLYSPELERVTFGVQAETNIMCSVSTTRGGQHCEHLSPCLQVIETTTTATRHQQNRLLQYVWVIV